MSDVAADHSPMLSWASFPSRVLPEFSFFVADPSQRPESLYSVSSPSRTSLELLHVQDMCSSEALWRIPVAFFLPAPGCWQTLSNPLFSFACPPRLSVRDKLVTRTANAHIPRHWDSNGSTTGPGTRSRPVVDSNGTGRPDSLEPGSGTASNTSGDDANAASANR